MSDIETRVKTLVVENLNLSKSPDEIDIRSKFTEDLGADSLDLVELVMALEEEFKIEIQDGDAEKIRTISDAIEYVKSSTSKAESK